NNVCALGVGAIYPVGFCGEDGEGYELRRALEQTRGGRLEYFLSTKEKRTFTYCKTLVMKAGETPKELNRVDSKNWTPTAIGVQERLADHIRTISGGLDAVIVLDQTDIAETGVVTRKVLEALSRLSSEHPQVPIIADSRRGLSDFPPFIFKMNSAE